MYKTTKIRGKETLYIGGIYYTGFVLYFYKYLRRAKKLHLITNKEEQKKYLKKYNKYRLSIMGNENLIEYQCGQVSKSLELFKKYQKR